MEVISRRWYDILFSALGINGYYFRKIAEISQGRCIMTPASSGLYIVTLNSAEYFSVNANDKRISDKCIKVNKYNCKFGISINLAQRERAYFRVFGRWNVNFYPIACLEEIRNNEKEILLLLEDFRMRGNTGRLNEWLKNITPIEVMKIVLKKLNDNKIIYEPLDGIKALQTLRIHPSFWRIAPCQRRAAAPLTCSSRRRYHP
jgi:hypothetical protein